LAFGAVTRTGPITDGARRLSVCLRWAAWGKTPRRRPAADGGDLRAGFVGTSRNSRSVLLAGRSMAVARSGRSIRTGSV